MSFRNIACGLGVMLVAALSGCEIPSQTFWSPDGSRAAYMPSVGGGSESFVIDENGVVLTKLGKSTGGFAWSADSKKLYFATIREKPAGAAPFEIKTNWDSVEPSAQPAPPPAPAAGAPQQVLAVSILENGNIAPLFWLEGCEQSWYMVLSPDEKWLAIAAQLKENDDKQKPTRSYVFSLLTQRLYPLAMASTGVCFTGPHRLALVEPESIHKGFASEIGHLTEVDLDEKADELKRQPLLLVIPGVTPWLQPLGDDLLLMSVSVTLPGPPEPDESKIYTLFRYVRADGGLKTIASGLDMICMPSPDAKRVLVNKRQGDARKLAVLDVASGQLHELCDLSVKVDADNAVPAYPAWRGNDQISFIVLPDEKQQPALAKERAHFDLALYQLTDTYQLKLIRMLSKDWPMESKPSIKTSLQTRPIAP